MRRNALSLTAAFLGLLCVVGGGSCKRRQSTAQKAAAPQTAAPASRKEFFLQELKKQKARYENLVKRAPGELNLHRRNAQALLMNARRLGDQELVKYFQKELARLDAEFRAKALKVFREAEREAETKNPEVMAPDEAWYEREGVWNACVEDLKALKSTYSNAGVIADLIRDAEARREEAYLLSRAYRRVAEAETQARADLEERDSPEDAVARLSVVRAFLRAEGLIDSNGEVIETEDRTETFLKSARALVKKLNDLLAEYRKKLPAPEVAAGSGEAESAPLADVPWEEVPLEDFLVYFRWASEGGTCESSGEAVEASSGRSGGIIEAESEQWSEFLLECEVQLAEGKRFWIGVRPVVSSGSGRPEYRSKVAVPLKGNSWHKIRVQLIQDRLTVFEISGSGPKELADPLDVPPVGGTVRAGFMIGLEPGTKLKLRAIRFKLKPARPGEKEGGEPDNGG